MAQRGLTVREWAVEEAIRVVTKSPRTSNADAARAAARRAAGLKAAAEAIGQLCRADDTAHLIPESIRLYLQSRISNEADGITDQNHIIRKRIRNWLLANPCELTRCKTPLAAIAAAAPVAIIDAQLLTPIDGELERVVEIAMESATESLSKLCTTAHREHRTPFLDVVRTGCHKLPRECS